MLRIRDSRFLYSTNILLSFSRTVNRLGPNVLAVCNMLGFCHVSIWSLGDSTKILYST